ncbi:nucleoside/nucleotide kinase family protein [Devosia epidermidihirudinis]|nr:nucleoside/nucleotide kinase family protein [Devosia epidermidihirudinis]
MSMRLVEALNRETPGSAVVMQMDGFHYDDGVLLARGLLPRKGAPDTFDLGGLIAMLARLRANSEPEIAAPVFDRTLEISRGSAAIFPQGARHIIVEGNYLLYQIGHWQGLLPYFDTTIWIHTAADDLRARLMQRWSGRGLSASEIVDKVEGNDLPNAELVQRYSAEPEFRVMSQEAAAETRTWGL